MAARARGLQWLADADYAETAVYQVDLQESRAEENIEIAPEGAEKMQKLPEFVEIEVAALDELVLFHLLSYLNAATAFAGQLERLERIMHALGSYSSHAELSRLVRVEVEKAEEFAPQNRHQMSIRTSCSSSPEE